MSKCSKCGKNVSGGIYYAIKHYAECYTTEEKEALTRKTMKKLGYSDIKADKIIKELEL